jgi:hypothetical protein
MNIETNMNNTNKTELLYPLCYKIKETCLPCKENVSSSCPSCDNTYCLEELSNFNKKQSKNDKEKENDLDKLFNCLKKYGDIYKKLGIELYVNPKTQQITFPSNPQIQSNLNLYLNTIDFNTKSPKTGNKQEENLMLFNILLNDKLRNAYNDFYYSNNFAELESLLPKKYGISRIMDTDYDKEGGRKLKKKGKTKKKRRYKRKRKTEKSLVAMR